MQRRRRPTAKLNSMIMWSCLCSLCSLSRETSAEKSAHPFSGCSVLLGVGLTALCATSTIMKRRHEQETEQREIRHAFTKIQAQMDFLHARLAKQTTTLERKRRRIDVIESERTLHPEPPTTIATWKSKFLTNFFQGASTLFLCKFIQIPQ